MAWRLWWFYFAVGVFCRFTQRRRLYVKCGLVVGNTRGHLVSGRGNVLRRPPTIKEKVMPARPMAFWKRVGISLIGFGVGMFLAWLLADAILWILDTVLGDR